jgi:hypothetical protein
VVEITGGQAGEFLAELDRHVVRHVAKRVRVGQLANLVGNRQGHFFAPQADIGAPHAAHGVEKAVALSVVDVGAITGDNIQGTLLGMFVEHVIAMHVVGFVSLDQPGLFSSGQPVFSWSSHRKNLEPNS